MKSQLKFGTIYKNKDEIAVLIGQPNMVGQHQWVPNISFKGHDLNGTPWTTLAHSNTNPAGVSFNFWDWDDAKMQNHYDANTETITYNMQATADDLETIFSRAVFKWQKSKGPVDYQFMGVYSVDVEATKELRKQGINKTVMRKVSDDFMIPDNIYPDC